MSNHDFIGKYGPVALVTGASSGIGRSFSELLASKGLDLVVTARRVERLEELATHLQNTYGVNVTVQQVDLAQSGAAQQLLDATETFDIGLLVSNAGFGWKGAFDSGDPHTLSDMLMVNCHAPLLLARGFLPRLKTRTKGGIIFTSSVEGLMGGPYSSTYAATKSFMNSLGEGLWAELASTDIHVLTLCPGATDTEAPRLQGIDPTTLTNVMSPDEVARLALENITDGPVYIPSEHYKATFDYMLSMPRRDALMAMAGSMKK